jgi:tryptophanyl-tRNA synthetase
MPKSVILTGIRANNDLHIGNYFGAIKPIVDMANTKSADYDINLFLPDLHSFTTPIDHASLKSSIESCLKTFVAYGLPLDIENVYLYRQSYVPAHSELTWILDNFTGYGEMQRMTQFKDKSASLNSERISLGLFNYPVLMASDILLYGASYVPVGEDQTQHLEFTRDIAERINKQFSEVFIVPKPVKEQHEFFGKDQGLRIKDLLNPTKKMSKSDESGKGVIFLSDSIEVAKSKIMGAATDSIGSINYDPANQPGISNLIDILALVTDTDKQVVIDKYKGQSQYGPLKTELADKIADFLKGFQEKLSVVDYDQINEKLAQSETKMNEVANQRLFKVQEAIGLR